MPLPSSPPSFEEAVGQTTTPPSAEEALGLGQGEQAIQVTAPKSFWSSPIAKVVFGTGGALITQAVLAALTEGGSIPLEMGASLGAQAISGAAGFGGGEAVRQAIASRAEGTPMNTPQNQQELANATMQGAVFGPVSSMAGTALEAAAPAIKEAVGSIPFLKSIGVPGTVAHSIVQAGAGGTAVGFASTPPNGFTDVGARLQQGVGSGVGSAILGGVFHETMNLFKNIGGNHQGIEAQQELINRMKVNQHEAVAQGKTAEAQQWQDQITQAQQSVQQGKRNLDQLYRGAAQKLGQDIPGVYEARFKAPYDAIDQQLLGYKQAGEFTTTGQTVLQTAEAAGFDKGSGTYNDLLKVITKMPGTPLTPEESQVLAPLLSQMDAIDAALPNLRGVQIGEALAQRKMLEQQRDGLLPSVFNRTLNPIDMLGTIRHINTQFPAGLANMETHQLGEVKNVLYKVFENALSNAKTPEGTSLAANLKALNADYAAAYPTRQWLDKNFPQYGPNYDKGTEIVRRLMEDKLTGDQESHLKKFMEIGGYRPGVDLQPTATQQLTLIKNVNELKSNMQKAVAQRGIAIGSQHQHEIDLARRQLSYLHESTSTPRYWARRIPWILFGYPMLDSLKKAVLSQQE